VLFLGSSVVEQSAVNRLAASSNLARGAILFKDLCEEHARNVAALPAAQNNPLLDGRQCPLARLLY